MNIYSALVPLPTILRAFGVLLVFRFVASDFGSDGLVEYAYLSILASIANTAAAGGLGNYYVSFFSKYRTISSRLITRSLPFVVVAFLLLMIIAVAFYFARKIEFVVVGGLFWLIVMLCYFFSSLSIFFSSFMAGFRDDKSTVLTGVFAALMFIGGAVFASERGDVFLFIWGLVGYQFVHALSSILVISLSFSRYCFSEGGDDKVESGEMLRMSGMSYSSAVSNSVFVYGWLSGALFLGVSESADIATLFRLTDIVGVLIGPFVSILIFPRICGWLNNPSLRTVIVRWFYRVMLLSLAIFSLLAIYYVEVVGLIFGREFSLFASYVYLFMLGEVFRVSLPVFGYALIDAKLVRVFFSIEFIYKILFGFIVYFLVSRFGLFYILFLYSIFGMCVMLYLRKIILRS